jgi:hypothetical protein
MLSSNRTVSDNKNLFLTNPNFSALSGHKSETLKSIGVRLMNESQRAVIPRKSGGDSQINKSEGFIFNAPHTPDEKTNEK